jgi:hypothetical protein
MKKKALPSTMAVIRSVLSAGGPKADPVLVRALA